MVYRIYRDHCKDIIYPFKSGNIRRNPESVILPGDGIRIFADPRHYKSYYVDI